MSVDTDEAILNRIKPERRVSEGTVSLVPSQRNVRATMPIEAVRHSGRDPDAPGEVSYFYLRNQGLLIFDLGGEFQ